MFRPFDRNKEFSRRKRNLPHWEQEGCTYFVTFRLADSLPKGKIEALKEEKEIWLGLHPKPWGKAEKQEHERRFVQTVQAWLDQGHGGCQLGRPEIGGLVESALRHFDGSRYLLDDFVVMPNHAHVLFQPLQGWSLDSTLHSWKSYTSSAINKRLGRRGRFWMDENFDHAVRSRESLQQFRRYIRNNPEKAGLRPGEFRLGRGTGIPACEEALPEPICK